LDPSQTEQAYPRAGALSFERVRRPLVEWLLWLAFATVVYSQTAYFDKEIAGYAFGATGWPRTLCVVLGVGATGQFLNQLLQIARGAGVRAAASGPRERRSAWQTFQQLGIFVLPLLYLYAMPHVGFYVATPVFVVCLLLLLEVTSPLALLGVTVTVYGLVLLVFTRLFFVALPVGNIEWFYAINNAIIEIVRLGM